MLFLMKLRKRLSDFFHLGGSDMDNQAIKRASDGNAEEIERLKAYVQSIKPASLAAPMAVTLYWSKASIVLNGLPDPFNPEIAKAEREARAGRVDPAVGQVVDIAKKVIFSVPVVGQIGAIVYYLFDTFIGPLVRAMNHGGFDDLTPLARQRALVYGLLPSQYSASKSKWASQRIPVPYAYKRSTANVLTTPGSTSTGIEAGNEAIAEQYAYDACRWTAMAAELFRVSQVPDEPMLPILVINLLYEAQEWPPPVRPVPLSFVEFRRRYLPPHPLATWGYDDLSQVTREYPDAAARGAARAEADYAKDAQVFASRVREIYLTAELGALAREAGCIPELGDLANGSTTIHPRGGIL